MSPLFIAGVALVFVGLVLSCLVPWAPRGIEQHPRCYGSKPGPQERAENDCEHCPHQIPCLMPAPADDYVCSECGEYWWTNDGRCHLCRSRRSFAVEKRS